jgi:hypothetical protein
VREADNLTTAILSAKLMLTFADRGVSRGQARNLGFLDPGRYFFFRVARQLYSRG